MTRILFVGDLHAKPQLLPRISRTADRVRATRIILLGDIMDDWTATGRSLVEWAETFCDWVEAERQKRQVTMLIGNHDVPYLLEADTPEYARVRDYGTPGFHSKAQRKIFEIFDSRLHEMSTCWYDDNVLASHAGFTGEWLDDWPFGLPVTPINIGLMFPGEPGKLASAYCQAGAARGGDSAPSPLWARRLLVLQNWDQGGIKPGLPRDTRTVNGKLMPPTNLFPSGQMSRFAAVWLQDGTLARTLLLDCPPYDPATGISHLDPADRPAWERAAVDAEELGGTPDGMADALTVCSRRIRLEHDADNQTTGMHMSYGRVTSRLNMTGIEPHCAWNVRPKTGVVPILPSAPRMMNPLWTQLPDMLLPLEDAPRPMTFDWAGELLGEQDAGVRLNVNWYGVTYARGVVDDMQHRNIPLCARLLSGKPAEAIADAVEKTNRMTASMAIFRTRTRIMGGNQDLTLRRTQDIEEACQLVSPTVEQALGSSTGSADDADIWLRALQDARRVILEDAEGRLRSGGPRPLAHNGHAAIEALSRLEYTTKITIEGEPDDTEDKPVKPAGGKRGRQARRITCRHGDETHTFPSAAKAAEWLRDDRQRPKASAASIYAAISRNRTYAGCQWEYAKI